MQALPTVSVTFLTRDRPQLIERALAAVLEDEATSEAIVVIDGEDPDTRAVLEPLARADPRVRIDATPPPGPDRLDNMQRGRDHSARLASSEIVLALDDDVVARPGLVSGHARAHAENPGAVAVVGYMPVATRPRWPRSYAPVRIYGESYEEHCEAYEADADSILPALWGGNVSVPRSDWLRAIEGGRVPCYHEDTEFGLLLRRAGCRGLFERALRGDHWYERDLRGFAARAERSVLALRQLRAAYPDLAEPEEELSQRRVHRALLRLARPAFGWLAVKWGLIALTSSAAALRLAAVEDRGAELLWRVAHDRAALLSPQPSSP